MVIARIFVRVDNPSVFIGLGCRRWCVSDAPPFVRSFALHGQKYSESLYILQCLITL